MRIARPHFVILVEVGVGPFQPGFIGVPLFLHRLIDIHKHGTHKRRLRAGQVVGSVGVQHRAVVLDLEEEVIYHAARQLNPSCPQQSTDDEVAVPTVHLVEAATRYYVLMFEIEQTVRLNFASIDLAQMTDFLRQVLDPDVALAGQFLNCGRFRNACWEVHHRRHLELRINYALAIGHRAGKRVPGGIDIGQNGLKSRRL